MSYRIIEKTIRNDRTGEHKKIYCAEQSYLTTFKKREVWSPMGEYKSYLGMRYWEELNFDSKKKATKWLEGMRKEVPKDKIL